MKTEKILALLALTGVILKFFHLEGATSLVFSSLFLLSVLYFPAAFYFFPDKDMKQQNLALSIVAGIFLSVVPIGILFKIQHWEGAQLYLSVGLVTIIVLLFVTYLLKTKAPLDLQIYYQNLIVRLVTLGVLSAVFYLIPAGIFLNL